VLHVIAKQVPVNYTSCIVTKVEFYSIVKSELYQKRI